MEGLERVTEGNGEAPRGEGDARLSRTEMGVQRFSRSTEPKPPSSSSTRIANVSGRPAAVTVVVPDTELKENGMRLANATVLWRTGASLIVMFQGEAARTYFARLMSFGLSKACVRTTITSSSQKVTEAEGTIEFKGHNMNPGTPCNCRIPLWENEEFSRSMNEEFSRSMDLDKSAVAKFKMELSDPNLRKQLQHPKKITLEFRIQNVEQPEAEADLKLDPGRHKAQGYQDNSTEDSTATQSRTGKSSLTGESSLTTESGHSVVESEAAEAMEMLRFSKAHWRVVRPVDYRLKELESVMDSKVDLEIRWSDAEGLTGLSGKKDTEGLYIEDMGNKIFVPCTFVRDARTDRSRHGFQDRLVKPVGDGKRRLSFFKITRDDGYEDNKGDAYIGFEAHRIWHKKQRTYVELFQRKRKKRQTSSKPQMSSFCISLSWSSQKKQQPRLVRCFIGCPETFEFTDPRSFIVIHDFLERKS